MDYKRTAIKFTILNVSFFLLFFSSTFMGSDDWVFSYNHTYNRDPEIIISMQFLFVSIMGALLFLYTKHFKMAMIFSSLYFAVFAVLLIVGTIIFSSR